MTTALDEPLAATSRQIVVGWSACSVDIETNPADGDRIFKIGAVTLMRAEGGRNLYFVDLGTVEGVVDTLPCQRPEHRPDIKLRYVTLGPADVDIGFAGRHGPRDPLHQRIARLSPGDPVSVSGRLVKAGDGQPVGRLASKTHLGIAGPVTGSISGILVRTRDQTPTGYRPNLKADRWETVLVEVVLSGS